MARWKFVLLTRAMISAKKVFSRHAHWVLMLRAIMPGTESAVNANRVSQLLWLAGATALVCAAGYLTFLVVGKGNLPRLIDVDGQPVSGLVNPLPQRRAHQAALVMLALVSIAAVFLPKRFVLIPSRESRIGRLDWLEPAVAVLVGIFLAVAIWLWKIPSLPPATGSVLFAGYYGLWASPSPSFYASSVIAAAALLGAIAAFGIPAARWLWAATLGYVLLLTLPGLFEPIALEYIPPGALQNIEWHFEAVMGGKYALLSEVPTHGFGSSFLFSLLQAIVERRGTFSFATDIRIIQAGNTAFALASLWACYVWNPKKPLVAIVTLGLLLPWVHNNHQNLFFPNQAGWRFISFPLMIIVMRHFAEPPASRRAIAFGAFAAFALLWNIETGIAVLLALLVYLAGRAERFGFDIWARMILDFAVGAGLAVGLVSLVYRAGLGSWPDLVNIGRYAFTLFTIVLSWDWGWPLYFDVLAFVIAVFAIWSVLVAALARRSASLDATGADRAALATLILVWGSYYIVHPHPWNLWSYLFPFGLLFGDTLFSGLKHPIEARWRGACLTVSGVVFVLVVGPACAVANWQAAESLWLGFRIPSTPPSTAAVFSGVRLPKTDVYAVAARLAYLFDAPNDARAFSGNSYLLPKLSGRIDLFPELDGAYVSGNVDQYRNIDGSVRQAAPLTLLFDDPATLQAGGPHEKYFSRLQQKLSDQYRPDLTLSGWWIWRRR
jgi:hypothetical protein